MKRLSLMYEEAPLMPLQISQVSDGDDWAFSHEENKYNFENLIHDMNISNLTNIVNMSGEEMKIVFAKLTDFRTAKEDIGLRHSLINDFVANESLLNRLEEQMSKFLSLRQDMMDAKKMSYRNNSASNDTVIYTKLVNACYYFNATYKLLTGFYNNIAQLELKSSKIIKILDYLEDLLKNSPIKTLHENCADFIDGINEGVLYDVEIKLNSILRIISIDIYDFRYPREESAGLFNFMMKKFAMEQKKYRDKHCYREKEFHNSNTINMTEDLYLKTLFNSQLNLIARRIVNIYETLIDIFKNVSEELIFYKFAVKLIKYYRSNGVEYCYSALNEKEDYIKHNANPENEPLEEKPRIYFKNLYDLSLLYYGRKAMLNVVSNDFESDDRHLTNIIIGGNQSGKTTFLRSLGLAMIFARSGIPVPASEANVFFFSRFYTHFERFDADIKNEGQLDLELGEMEKIVYDADGKSIILMNESFSSTGVKDAMSIAGDVMSAFSHIGATVLFVTHLPHLAERLKTNPKMNGKNQVRLFKTDVDDEGKPNYKVIEQII